MKLIEIYENVINELIDIEPNTQQNINKAKEDKSKIIISWDNGNIFNISNGFPSGTSLNFINFNVDYKLKEVNYFDIDDTSNYKKILRIQQALKDLMKSNSIDNSFKIIFNRDKKTTKNNLTSIKVNDVIKLDLSYSKGIPKAYHGTSDYYLVDINKFGLRPQEQTNNYQHDNYYTSESSKNIYLTTDIEVAKQYARMAVENLKDNYKIKSKPIIIEINDIPIENTTTDDDIQLNVGSAMLLYLLGTGKQKTNYISGIRQTTQFAYKGRIPKTMISKIIK